jgi:hypothetical protein
MDELTPEQTKELETLLTGISDILMDLANSCDSSETFGICLCILIGKFAMNQNYPDSMHCNIRSNLLQTEESLKCIANEKFLAVYTVIEAILEDIEVADRPGKEIVEDLFSQTKDILKQQLED